MRPWPLYYRDVALIEIAREVPLSQEDAWSRLTDWKRHGEFVPLTTIGLTASGFVAHTGVGPLAFDDPMEITIWRPPAYCRLEKRGRVVTGWTEIEIEPAGERTRVTWREDLHVTGMPRFMDGATRASSRALFSRVIDRLLTVDAT